MELETSISRHFGHLPDPRIERCKLHKLIDIVSITICAVISNADGWEDIEAYGHAKETLFRSFLELPGRLHLNSRVSWVWRPTFPVVLAKNHASFTVPTWYCAPCHKAVVWLTTCSR